MLSENYIKSNMLSTNLNIKHFFGRKDFIVPNNERVIFLNQVHGDKVIDLEDLSSMNSYLEGDAILTSKKDLFVGVRTADCVPILLTSKDGSFVAAVHSGWRGTYNKIIENVIRKVLDKYQCSVDDIICSIGPSIGECCYEVGRSMMTKFNNKFVLSNEDFSNIDGKSFLNLANINKKIINKLGVSNVELLTNCTCCEDSFFSYRRDGSRMNNQISIIKTIR